MVEGLGYLISNKVKHRYADLPYNLPYRKIGDVYSLLSFHYDNYLSEVKNYGFDGEDVCKGLKKAWKSYEGSIEKAYDEFSRVMDMIKEDVMEVSNYCNKFIMDTYYRGRISKDELTERKEMFHSPFSCASGNCRYSMEGEHFLYLGGTTYTCYMELGKPTDTSNLYFSRYEIPEDLKILSVGILPYEILDFIDLEKKQDNRFEEEKLLKHYINMLPLIMACSIRRRDVDKESSKQSKQVSDKSACPKEYYISQLLTKWVVNNSGMYDGIEYFSNEVPTHSKRNYKLYRNLAVFAQRISNEEYDLKLSSKLKLTKPVRVKENIELFSEYGSEDNSFLNLKKIPDQYDMEEVYNYVSNRGISPFYKSGGRIQNEKKENGEVHYSSSGFSLLEYELSKEKVDYITT